MIDIDYPNLLKLFPEHLDPKRSESAAFLIWYLENYYRLDQTEAVDSVCDQSGDKGVDGIFVNDNDQTITIFQSRISQSSKTKIGDKPLREFAGTITQFNSAEAIQHLIDTAGGAQVASLAKRLDLVNKIATHELRGEYVANIDTDANGNAFLKKDPHIAFVGKKELLETYISDERNIPKRSAVKFDITGFPVSEYIVDTNTRAVIAPIKATELATMNGISDQSLFAYNVRGALGRTQVNKDIVKSLRDQKSHKLFPLFHNGITVIAGQLDVDNQTLEASEYFVVNGCQSLTAIYNNRPALTDNLRVLVKFIKMDPQSDWARMITEFSNNQNSVKPRDFKANNPIQIRLQNEFKQLFADQYTLEIKRGETLGSGQIISNENAGLYLMAFDLKEPWATHRKYEVFEDKHADLFGRPEVTADRIVMCQVIADAIQNEIPTINNSLLGRYVLTRYCLLYIVRSILEVDELAQELIKAPQGFIRDAAQRARFQKCIKAILGDVIVDLNAEVDEYGDNFDYRDKLRDAEWVRALSKKVVGDYTKQVKRGRIPSFKQEWGRSSQSN